MSGKYVFKKPKTLKLKEVASTKRIVQPYKRKQTANKQIATSSSKSCNEDSSAENYSSDNIVQDISLNSPIKEINLSRNENLTNEELPIVSSYFRVASQST